MTRLSTPPITLIPVGAILSTGSWFGLGAFTFVRYAIESVFRNRRRSLYAVVGVVIAISLVSGSFIAVDSSAYGRLRAALEEVRTDFLGYAYFYDWESIDPSEMSAICAELEVVQHVEDANILTSTTSYWYINSTDDESTDYVQGWNIVLMSEDCDRLLDEWNVEGELPDEGTVALGEPLANYLGVTVGDQVLLSYWRYNGSEYVNGTYIEHWVYANLTLQVSQLWTQGDIDYPDWYGADNIIVGGTQCDIVMNLADLHLLAEPLQYIGEHLYVSTSVHVWIDRSEVIDLGDIQGTLEGLEFIRNRLNYKAAAHDIMFYDSPLANALIEVNTDISGMKTLFLGLSLPVVALGAYLSLVGVDLGVSARRREVGILKSRGASNRQVFTSLFVESVTLGCVAGFIGLLIGILISRFLVDTAVVFSTYSSDEEVFLTDISIGTSSIVSCMLLGILLMVASAYRPLKRASKVAAAEALHYYVRKETKVDYKARWDFIALGLVALSVFSVMTSGNPLDFGGSFLVAIILGIMWLIGIAMLPALPFLLSASVIRLLTRGSKQLYKRFTRLVRPWTKGLHYLVDKNIVRNPKRASNMCIIIALALAFGLFISITMETTIQNQIRSIRSEIGSDVRLMAFSYRNTTTDEFDINISMLNTVDSMDGVDGSARCYQLSFYTGEYYTWGTAVVLDPEKYIEVVGLEDSWFGRDTKSTLLTLKENGTALISEWFAEANYLIVGDLVTIRCAGIANFTLEIVGILDQLPGLYGDLYVDVDTVDFVPEPVLAQNILLFVDVHDGVDQTEVAWAIEEVYRAAGAQVYSMQVFDERLAEIESDPTYGALSDFLYMEYALSFIIMCVGVGLVVFVTVSERERELACIMARGSSSSQMRKVLMGESLTLMFLGFIVGTSVGIFSAWLFDILLQFADSGAISSFITIGWVTLGILGASLVSFVLASLLATYRVGKLRLAEVLRIRGG